MASRTYDFRNIIQKIVKQMDHKRPTWGVVHSLDGDTISITLGGFSAIVREVRVIGDISTLAVGQKVYLLWDQDRPVALASASGGSTERSNIAVAVDNDTIERSYEGLRVRRGSIGKEHLDFAAADADHEHIDHLARAGWKFSEAGVMYNGSTRIYPDGEIVLGEEDEAIFLNSNDDDYRLWVGAAQGDFAPFAVDKLGQMKATAGHIGGWQIGTHSIFSDIGNAEINSLIPFIRLGAESYLEGEGFWVGKYGSVYRLRIGSETQYLNWDGQNLVIQGNIDATTGHIGGWSVLQYSIEADAGNAQIRSDIPSIQLGATSYLDGDGFWVGKDSGQYKLRIGNASEFLRWTGDAIEISGTLRLGNPPPTAPDAGTGIYLSNQGLYGLNQGIQQIFIDTFNGKLSAGEKVLLDENGITIGPQLVLNRMEWLDVDVELQWGRTTGGNFSIFWNGDVAWTTRVFKPYDLLINRISDTEPSQTWAGMVWLDP